MADEPEEDTVIVVDDDEEEDDDDDDEMIDVEVAPSLHQTNSFFRQTRRKGKILKTVQEIYLRDDLGLGSLASNGRLETMESTEQLLNHLQTRTALVVCDTNSLLHNCDVLDRLSTDQLLVIPQTALSECKHQQRSIYDRAIEMIRSGSAMFFADAHHVATAAHHHADRSSINDVNDARIRNVAKFLTEHLRGSAIPVILLTDDAASRALAAPDMMTHSVSDWVQRSKPECSDLVAQFHSSEVNAKPKFPPHWTTAQVTRGIQSGRLHKGVFRKSHDTAVVVIRKGNDRVSVTLSDDISQNRAVDGDSVALQLNPVEEWIGGDASVKTSSTISTKAQIAAETAEPTLSDVMNVRDVMTMDDATQRRPTGKVVGILRRNFGNHCGSIFRGTRHKLIAEHERDHPDGSSTCVFFPVDDKKVPPIIIRTTQRDRLLGQRIVVAMDAWPADSAYPLGHYVRTIGPAGTKDVETQVLLQQHDIPHEPFSAAVLACLPSSDFAVECTEDRMDLRHLPILSIDPPGCKDIDDALHCIELDNGNWQVGVHIADVTHYVKPGTPIDLEAADRSTSTYLVNKRLDMLPGLLTTDLCSLKGNVDRYAFSVLWEVTKDAEIINVEFKKSVIHSIAALTYQQAQILIDQPDDPNDIQGGAVKRLAHLARKFRKRRIDAGALTLASPEVKFVLDSESLNPTDVQSYAMFEANAVVEEFMLLANVTVAKKILRHYPTLSILRRHPSPNRAMFDGLISKAKSLGFDINIEDSKMLADSLDAAVDKTDPYINNLLRILSTRCMSPAQYFCSGEFRPQEWHHYGLAAPVYTHFTSPIRRYADVCVHRLLAASIGVAPLPPHLSSKTYLHDLAANMNRRHRAAQLAGRASVQLHTLIFFAGVGEREEDAYVLDVETTEGKTPAFTVMVPRYGIEVKVKLPMDESDVSIERYPAEHRVAVKQSHFTRSIKVFDKVKVKIRVVEIENHHRELIVDLVPMGSAPSKRQGDPRGNPAEKKQRT